MSKLKIHCWHWTNKSGTLCGRYGTEVSQFERDVTCKLCKKKLQAKKDGEG